MDENQSNDRRISFYEAFQIVARKVAEEAFPEGSPYDNQSYSILGHREVLYRDIMADPELKAEHRSQMLCCMYTRKGFPQLVETWFGEQSAVFGQDNLPATAEEYRKQMLPICRELILKMFIERMKEYCFIERTVSPLEQSRQCNLMGCLAEKSGCFI